MCRRVCASAHFGFAVFQWLFSHASAFALWIIVLIWLLSLIHSSEISCCRFFWIFFYRKFVLCILDLYLCVWLLYSHCKDLFFSRLYFSLFKNMDHNWVGSKCLRVFSFCIHFVWMQFTMNLSILSVSSNPPALSKILTRGITKGYD